MSAKDENVAKITVTKDAEEAVSQVVAKVNDGFEAGRVNRQDISSWILSRFFENLSDSDIEQIRASFFDEIVLLEALLKKAKQSGSVPLELKALLGQLNTSTSLLKVPKKSLTKKSINDGLGKNEEAA